MGTNKHIGSAIEERLKEYHSSPDDLVWEAIEAKLKKEKKDRKIIFFWLFGGIITLSIVLFSLGLNSTDSIINETTPKLNQQDSKINVLQENPDSNQSNEIGNEIGKEPSNENNKVTNAQVLQSPIISKNQWLSSKKTSTTIPQNSVIIADEHQSDVLNHVQNRTGPKNHTLKSDSLLINKDSLLVASSATDKKTRRPLAEKDSSTIKTESKWSIYPNVSVNYYGAFGVTTTDQISLNYGVYLNYLAAKDLSLRIGVHKLNLQHTITDSNSMTMLQKVSYVELPFELKYSPFKTKISTSFIGGFSYLLLDDASIGSTASYSTQISNKHLFNSSTLSVNIGLGFQVKLFKKLHFNIEPLFKYQIKPFSESVDFSPFNLSLSGGIEYKF